MRKSYQDRWGHPRSRQARATARKAMRRQAAMERQAAYDRLTLEQKIARAKARPGQSGRELERLSKEVRHD